MKRLSAVSLFERQLGKGDVKKTEKNQIISWIHFLSSLLTRSVCLEWYILPRTSNARFKL